MLHICVNKKDIWTDWLTSENTTNVFFFFSVLAQNIINV